jgi:hypothetical protein
MYSYQFGGVLDSTDPKNLARRLIKRWATSTYPWGREHRLTQQLNILVEQCVLTGE